MQHPHIRVTDNKPYRGPYHLERRVIPALCEYVARFWHQLGAPGMQVGQNVEVLWDKQTYLGSLDTQ